MICLARRCHAYAAADYADDVQLSVAYDASFATLLISSIIHFFRHICCHATLRLFYLFA